ncbi:uncharacterized protein DNG_04342 [Cephalotrichum gorgonifer]|uniref:Uncharacterized protein n=1 Tax=Cephalotrichum gorgonifer TaxID=2041049 RepID=A0AAE8MXU1_9PEZI|nr:uncharacterized protein DNG_04342 [Cephalotrichum gorgonifer]
MPSLFCNRGISAAALSSLSALLIAWYFYPWKATWGPTTIPGVAFSLTPNYGTAAIHYANGSTISVARVEGSRAYQDFMRREAAPVSTTIPFCDYIPSALGPLALGMCACPVREDTASVEALMRELRASVASSMGTDFCYADLVLPSRLQAPPYQKEVIVKALKNIGLVQPSEITRDAGLAAIYANGLGGSFDGGVPPGLVLVVGYSHSGLSAQLFWRSPDGLVLSVREDHSLGRGPHTDERAPSRTAGLREVLQAVAEPPFGDDPTYVDGGDPLPTEIAHLVLHGDAVNDTAFREILRDALGPRLAEAAVARDPVFASAAFYAGWAYNQINDMAFGKEPAFGCCWGSRWHNCWEYRQVVYVHLI